jgi:hypothetical protein
MVGCHLDDASSKKSYHLQIKRKLAASQKFRKVGLAAAARQKIWNDGCLLGNCTLCSVGRRNMSILKDLAQDASINANGGSQEVWTAPLAALPHGRKEPLMASNN